MPNATAPNIHFGVMQTIFFISALCALTTVADARASVDGDTLPAAVIAPTDTHGIADTVSGGADSSPVDSASFSPAVFGPDTTGLPRDSGAADFFSLIADTAVSITHPDTLKPPPAPRRKKRHGPLFSPPESLYTGISSEQDYHARLYVRQVFAFSWEDAERTVKRLQRIERKDHLSPLSGLLMVSSRVIRVINGEFENDREQRKLLHEIDDIRERTLKQVESRKQPDSLLSVNLFIGGGIRGLVAVLKIESAMVEAAIDGLAALHRLERLIQQSPGFYDAYLGLGIFHCLLARAPGIVRAALNMGGRQFTFDKGLDYLRISAAGGRYTSELASLYLVRFLSPYWGHLTEEKDRILNGLRRRYPDNPYYVFLACDEDICFHPERLDRAYARSLEETICSWKAGNFSLRRYDNLARHQLRFIADSSGTDSTPPDSSFDLGEFSFYPQFLEALRESRHRGRNEDKRSGHRRGQLTKNESAALRELGLSNMSSARKNFYEWHIRDALKLR
ncbi:MAG: hypothetical protein JW913_09540 [Chitinispirillaceae bacterium]|nr:hypothetical protein [Chitinispirillaceae bacterium]